MDLYGINPALRKGLSDRSHPPSGPHNDITKLFASNDILSSSAWSSVIHQPAQDSEPEDLPSTVDIDAIKEPPTPINASAQTPAGELNGDCNSFELSDDQNAGDSGSDSDSDSESGNSENEAESADTGPDSGSCSDSDSVSSRHSSSSSNGKHPSARSSRSNTPPSNSEDNQHQIPVQKTNFKQGQYSSNLLEAFVEKIEQLNKNNAGKKSSSSETSSSDKPVVQTKVNPPETTRKRGRPPKTKISSMAEIEAYMRLDCTISNVSPDSGIQSNSGSPLYHGVPSPAICSSTSRSSGSSSKHNAAPPNLKSLSLSQKALLSACKKTPYQSQDTKERRQTFTQEAPKVDTMQAKISPVNESSMKSAPRLTADALPSSKSCKSTSVSSRNSDDMLKVPPYLGSKMSPTPVNVISSPACNNLTLFPEKRGPGRPKKRTPAKLNGQTGVEKVYADRIDNRFEKSYQFSLKPAPIMSNDKPKKPLYTGPVTQYLESSKKRDKKRNSLSGYPAPVSVKMAPAFVPPFSTHKGWLRKHKKSKKKDSKEKTINPELLEEVENLAEVFGRKCVIEDEKSLADVNSQFLHSASVRSKGTHRVKDRSKKRKHGDNDSESESNSVVSITASDTKTKRRHKKSAIETSKVPETCDLPKEKMSVQHAVVSLPAMLGASTSPQSPGKQPQSLSKQPQSLSKQPQSLSKQPQSPSKQPQSPSKQPQSPSKQPQSPSKRPLSPSKQPQSPGKQPQSPNKQPLLITPLPPELVTPLTASPSPKPPQLITPLPSEPAAVPPTVSPSLKPPAGVFEPTRKLPPPLSRSKKNSINDVLSMLKEKLKVLESPMENASTLIEKIGGGATPTADTTTSMIDTATPTVDAATPVVDATEPPSKRVLRSKRTSVEQETIATKKSRICTDVTIRLPKLQSCERVLRSKRPSAEQENIAVKKSRMCTDVTIRLPKLQSCEIASAQRDEEEEAAKPKVRRRRNRTGFPVKKKKKMKRNLGAPTLTVADGPPILPSPPQLVASTLSESQSRGNDAAKNCPHIVKNEANDGVDSTDEDEVPLALRAPPVLSAIRVKSEVMSEDEGKTGEKRALKSNAKKMKTESTVISGPNRVAPSRCSARINHKQQLRAREMKRMKKKEKKAAAQKKNSRTVRGRLVAAKGAAATSKKEVENRRYERREMKSKNNVVPGKSVDSLEKETKTKEETDKDELSDDSVKCSSQKKDAAPKKRRKFIPAGLFSEYYKEDRNVAPDPKNRFTPYKSKDHPHGLLPPPPYFEDWVRRRRVDFKLPYDLWWLHTHDQLPGRDVLESWKYKRIRMNVYYDVKPTNIYEAQACNCAIPTEKNQFGCGEDCINRVVYAECSPQLCPLKERCSNQRIQKHDGDLKLRKFMTADKGIGVKTERPIKAGEYILEYVGEVVTDKEFKKRMTSLYQNDIHHYCLNLDGGLVIDGHRMGSDGRFVNHSCEPNCEIQKWNVNGLFRMALFARRDIEAGEELTYDYNFRLFNPEVGQPCRCGSSHCRGVIGGKSQRVTIGNGKDATVLDSSSHSASNAATNNASNKKSRVSRRKQIRKKVTNGVAEASLPRRDSEGCSNVRVLPHRNVHPSIPVTPLTAEEKRLVGIHRYFLPRNLIKVQRVQERNQQFYNKENSNSLNQNAKSAKSKQSVDFLMQLNALSKQRVKTRGLAQVEDNPEMTKTLQLANSFRTIYNFVVNAKDETSGETFSSLFMNLPSKRKLPIYYQRVGDPIDLSTIKKNIDTGVYKDVESFDKDMNKLISNNVKYYGRISDEGIAAVRLNKEYNIAKLQHIPQIEKIIGQPVPSSFRLVQEDPGGEDVIRCICGLFNDEGLMIQCEHCLVWQHCGCVGADSAVEHYHCERCSAREVDYEIPLDVEPPDQPKPDEKHYLTLMRDDLQIRLGDTVYVLRDIPNPETGSRHTFRTIKTFKYEDCDIYRVEQLWKTKDGEKFSFGHHYLRPHETFHEPTRKFYPNEVVKIALFETVPLDLIMGRCYVLDVNTYCKGRPIDSDPEHIYICEYRVDQHAKSFYKMKPKQHCSVSTKNYAFEKYDTRLKPSRTYAPYGVARPTTSTRVAVTSTVTKSVNGQKARLSKCKESTERNRVPVTKSVNSQKARLSKYKESTESNRMPDAPVESSSTNVKIDDDNLPLAHIKDLKLEKQKQRLDNLLRKLLAKKPTKAPLDVTYLLDDILVGRRNRKKPAQPAATNNA